MANFGFLTMSSTIICPNCKFVLAGNKPPHSPVSCLLDSNAVPSDSQTVVIQRVIAEARADILQLDADIVQVRSVLDQLVSDHQNVQTSSKQSFPGSLAEIFFPRKQAEILRLHTEIEQVRVFLDQLLTERWELHTFMKDHCALLSPIRRLCPELLSEVFIQCLSAWGHQSDTITPLQAPWLLGQICSGWRAVALSTPRLWSSIDVYVTGTGVIPQGDALQTWLARSKACPLSLSIAFLHSPQGTPNPAFDAIVSSCHRWQDLNISYLPTTSPPQSFRIINGPVPLLRRLRIGDATFGLYELLPLMVLTAPQLRILELGCGAYVHLPMLGLPWAQLTHCDGEIASVEDGLDILHTCENLVECTLEYTQRAWGSFGYLPPVIQHHQLRRLQITAWGGEPAATLFDRLDLPALRELDIGPVESWPQPQFMSFLRRTLGSMERLTLRGVSLTGNDLMECLSELPALNHLHINEPINSKSILSSQILTDKVLRRLTSDLAPNLRSITFHGPPFTDSLFAIMVQSRWKRRPGYRSAKNRVPARVHLQFVDLVLQDEMSPQTLNRLERFRREGLNVRISNC